MSSPAPQSKSLSLEQLPAFVIPNLDEKSRAKGVFHYLEKLITRELRQPHASLLLPSLAQFSSYLQCEPLEIYDALRALRQQGYEYQFAKFEQPLLIWQKIDPIQEKQRRNL